MTNKRLDRKFMSWVWGILRLFPLFLFFFACISIILQFQQQGNIVNESGSYTNFSTILLDGQFDSYFDTLINLLPNFIWNFYFTFVEYFYPGDTYNYLVDIVALNCFYQVWISILQIFINVLMILPNISNYFIEKFVHLGNKGDY